MSIDVVRSARAARLMTGVAGGVLGAACLCIAGCANASGERNAQVTRVDPETVIDYDYRFDDEDARQVYRGMVNDALSKPWIDNWVREHGGKRPIVLVGNVRNETQDYIDTKLITKRIEEEFINSGRVRIVAERDQRGEVRDERVAGQEFNRPETIKKVANELGADFMLIGRVGDIKERSGDRSAMVNYYQFNLEMVDIESNEKVWIQTQEVKKNVRFR